MKQSKMSAPIVQWICRELSKLLGFEATDDIAKYIYFIQYFRKNIFFIIMFYDTHTM